MGVFIVNTVSSATGAAVVAVELVESLISSWTSTVGSVGDGCGAMVGDDGVDDGKAGCSSAVFDSSSFEVVVDDLNGLKKERSVPVVAGNFVVFLFRQWPKQAHEMH